MDYRKSVGVIRVSRNHSRSEICDHTTVATFVQGCIGTSCPSVMFGACLLFAFGYFKHSSQFKTNFSNCSLIPGQYTISLHQSLHFPRPKWPSCINCNICLSLLLGITIQVQTSLDLSGLHVSIVISVYVYC